MMSDAEVLAGLAFLEKHAPEHFQPALRMARGACEAVRGARTLDETRERSIDDLEVSVRTANALAHMGFKTVGDVERFMQREDRLIMIEGKRAYFGKKIIKEVREVLKNIGLQYRAAVPVTSETGT